MMTVRFQPIPAHARRAAGSRRPPKTAIRLALDLLAALASNRPQNRRRLNARTFPSFAGNPGRTGLDHRVMPLPPDRFLGRPAVEPDPGSGGSVYRGRSILVTGAGGSIGGELCRPLLACRPARLVLLDLSEAALYAIDKDLRANAGSTEIVPIIGSVTDRAMLRALFARHPVEVVFHAAAYKHVTLVEANPAAGVENNVFGTRILAEEAKAACVARFILISTDKAVRPGNVMGATKRLAELAVQDLGQRERATRFSIVRFGNVLGSSGSVIPLFREQIARGGPVTLTHPDVTRYFMTLAEAARLVLATGAIAEAPETGADVFVLDMGPPVRIRDLALRMIAAAGLRPRDADHPDGDIEIVLTGLRPGEKLHEELLIGHRLLPTPNPRILRASEASLSEFEIANALSNLRAALSSRDVDALRRALFTAVEPGGGRDAPATAAAPMPPSLALPH
jgi:FlaA1/EpsC-like NDP-sugar epimerase